MHDPILKKCPPCLLLVSTVVALSAGCSSQQLYSTGQSYQRNQCHDMLDQGERERCLSRTNTSYEDYKRETGADKK